MKKLYFLFTFLFLTHFAKAQDPDAFIMTFRQHYLVHIPIVEDPTNNYTIDFGDGTVEVVFHAQQQGHVETALAQALHNLHQRHRLGPRFLTALYQYLPLIGDRKIAGPPVVDMIEVCYG